LNLSATETS